MRLSRLGLSLVLSTFAGGALAQVPAASAPAPEPAPAPSATVPEAPPPTPPAPPVTDAPPPAPEAPKPAPTEQAPAPTPPAPAAPEPAPTAPEPEALPLDAAGTVKMPPRAPESTAPPWPRAHSPLTLEGRFGFLLRPESGNGFDDESHTGAELGASLYLELKRELAAGLEIERASLGRGTAIRGLDSVSIDYTVSSAMLGLRAYPKRTELFDVFVGIQVGVGIQGVSATGTANNGALGPASSYRCGASDSPAFQIGGGIGARLMLSPRWGISARVNGTGRRLSGELVEDCAQGLGTATTLSAGLGLGYDFELEP